MGTEPRKGTPEGDQFDGKVYMAVGAAVAVLCGVLGVLLLGLVLGGAVFALGALKWHAGLVRRR